MEMESIRQTARRIGLVFIGVIDFILLLRFLVLFFSANQQQTLVAWVLNLTSGLVTPFAGAAPNLRIGAFVIDVPTVMALIVYTVVLLIVFEFVIGFIDNDPARIGVNFIDVILKSFEFLLIARIVLKVLAVPETANQFVGSIYNSTEWANGIIPALPVGAGVLELSVVVVFIVIVLVDIWLERVVLEWLTTKRTHRQVVEAKVVSRAEFERLKSQS